MIAIWCTTARLPGRTWLATTHLSSENGTLARYPNVGDFTLGRHLETPGNGMTASGASPFGCSQPCRKLGSGGRSPSFAFGSARIDPGYQRIDILLAEPGVVAELHARRWDRPATAASRAAALSP